MATGVSSSLHIVKAAPSTVRLLNYLLDPAPLEHLITGRLPPRKAEVIAQLDKFEASHIHSTASQRPPADSIHVDGMLEDLSQYLDFPAKSPSLTGH
jgi:hypothetical protein